MSYKYAVVYERAGNNWSAYVPDLPGCTSAGNTLDECKVGIEEAIELYIEELQSSGEPVPDPTTVVGIVERTA